MALKKPEPDPADLSAGEISALVHKAQANDAGAFEQLIRLHESRLHRQAFFLTGDEHQALDLMQNTLVEAWKHLARYDGRAQFFSWVCGIMLHRHYDWLRRLRTRAFAAFTAPADASIAADAPDPSEWADELERARLMRECLDELPARQRTAVYLRFYAGESIHGIAAIAGCSPGTVKSRLFHALQRLAKMQKLRELQPEK